jgi:hypothetical protein
MGAPSTPAQQTYFGSAAQVVGCGPKDILWSIKNGDVVIWQGPIFRSEAADVDGKTVLATTIGTIHWFWGVDSQAVDSLLATLNINQGNGLIVAPMPAFKKVALAVLHDCAFGQQTTPPTLKFEYSRFPAPLTLDVGITRVRVTNGGTGYGTPPAVGFVGGGGTGAAAAAVVSGGVVTAVNITSRGSGYTTTPTITFTGGGGTGAAATAYRMHEINGDAIGPEVIYDFLTNTFYGGSIPTSNFITQDFIDASQTILTEGLGISPVIDEAQTIREVLGKITVYNDGFLYFDKGKLGYKLIRQVDLTGVVSLTEDDFTDEPEPQNKNMQDTWNFTLLTFTDRSNKYEEGVEPFDNPASAEALGLPITKSVQYPFITLRAVAKLVAKRVGLKAGVPAFFFDVKLLPKHRARKVGEVVKLSWAKLGLSNVACRVTKISRGKPEDMEVAASLMVEQTRDTSHDYIPPSDFFTTPGTIGSDGTGSFALVSVSPRLSELPAALKSGSADGWLTAYDRSDQLLRRAKVWWTWDAIQKPYVEIDVKTSFPIACEPVCWHQINLDTWLLRLRFPKTWDLQQFAVWAINVPDFLGTLGYRKVKLVGAASNIHQLISMWVKKVEGGYAAAVDSDMYDIEVAVGQYGTDAPLLETIAAPAQNPTRFAYFGRLDDFSIVRSDSINFDRNAPNAPFNPVTGINPDTDLKRLVKVTVANHKTEQGLSDVSAVNFDRNDATMNAGGTLSADWGPRVMNAAEFLDSVLGDGFVLASAGIYPDGDDYDDALGAIYAATATDNQKLLAVPIDNILGLIHELRNGVYNNLP